MLSPENEPFSEPHADFLKEQLPDCQSVQIPGASHNAHVDNPEFTRSELREFFEDVSISREATAT